MENEKDEKKRLNKQHLKVYIFVLLIVQKYFLLVP